MSLWKIAWRSIQQRGLASSLTTLSMALGVMLVVAVLLIHGLVTESFKNNSSLGYNMIVGPKGGKLQLVLNTVYYLSQPVENIPYDFYLEFLTAEEVKRLHTDEELDALVEKRRGTLTRREARELAELSPAEQRERLLEGDYAYGTAGEANLAIPVLLGDYYKEYRVVGTSTKLFDELEYIPEEKRKYRFADGGNFKRWDEENGYFEAVAGWRVAQQYDLKLGDRLVASHGAAEGEGELHDESAFTLVGILAPSGTPVDRAVFVNMEGFYLMEGHAKPVIEEELPATEEDFQAAADDAQTDADDSEADGEDSEAHAEPDESIDEDPPEDTLGEAASGGEGDSAGDDQTESKPSDHAAAHESHADEAHSPGAGPRRDPLPLDEREVTAILLKTDAFASMAIANEINEGQIGQAVMPIAEIYTLLEMIVRPIQTLLLVITTLICVVSGVSILVSIYNSMSERRHEIAVIRALGAGRGTVMFIVLLESIFLSVAGGLLGLAVGHLAVWAAGGYIESQTGVRIGLFDFVPMEVVIIPALVLLAIIVGFMPALTAYRTDVAKSLQ